MDKKIQEKLEKEKIEYEEYIEVFDVDFCIKGKKAM